MFSGFSGIRRTMIVFIASLTATLGMASHRALATGQAWDSTTIGDERIGGSGVPVPQYIDPPKLQRMSGAIGPETGGQSSDSGGGGEGGGGGGTPADGSSPLGSDGMGPEEVGRNGRPKPLPKNVLGALSKDIGITPASGQKGCFPDIKESGKSVKLAQAMPAQVMKPRAVAKFMGGGTRSGNVSKGMCSQAVSDGIASAGIKAGRANAAQMPSNLQRASPPMKNILSSSKCKNDADAATDAPRGAILVFAGGKHGYGHIEVKVDDKNFCSDYCKGKPANTYMNRKLIGIYLPQDG